jgi:hypothetical protein
MALPAAANKAVTEANSVIIDIMRSKKCFVTELTYFLEVQMPHPLLIIIINDFEVTGR